MRCLYPLFLILLLSACNPQNPISCAELRDNPLLQLQAAQTVPDEMTDWVLGHYDVASAGVRVTQVDSDETWVDWSKEDVYHQVRFRNDEIEIMYLNFNSRRISAEDLINCLGTPDFYRARAQPDEELSLYSSFLYSELGMEISGGTTIKVPDPKTLMTPEIDFDLAEIRSPNTLPEIQDWVSWKPWRGWAEIEVDRQPD